LCVDVAGKAVGVGFLFESVGLGSAHWAADGDEKRSVSVRSEDLRVEVRMLAGDDADLLLRLILMVIGVGDDSPLVSAVG
jgi:hypothetical protein